MIQVEEEKFKEVISKIKELRSWVDDNIDKEGGTHSALEWNMCLSIVDVRIKAISKLLGIKDEPNKNRNNQEVSGSVNAS